MTKNTCVMMTILKVLHSKEPAGVKTVFDVQFVFSKSKYIQLPEVPSSPVTKSTTLFEDTLKLLVIRLITGWH